jgi:hypothetical protein
MLAECLRGKEEYEIRKPFLETLSQMNPDAHGQESHVSVADKQLHLSESGQESLCLV